MTGNFNADEVIGHRYSSANTVVKSRRLRQQLIGEESLLAGYLLMSAFCNCFIGSAGLYIAGGNFASGRAQARNWFIVCEIKW